jgi:hypothetical protein
MNHKAPPGDRVRNRSQTTAKFGPKRVWVPLTVSGLLPLGEAFAESGPVDLAIAGAEPAVSRWRPATGPSCCAVPGRKPDMVSEPGPGLERPGRSSGLRHRP